MYLNFFSQFFFKRTTFVTQKEALCAWATVHQHPPAHHPLDVCYYWVLDEPQLS
jgi:hypothetical protein